MTSTERQFGQLIEPLEPRHLQRYLAAKGWTRVDELPTGVLRYHAPAKMGGSKFMAMVPRSQGLADYTDMVIAVARMIAALERRSLLDVALQLRGPTDILKIRVGSIMAADGGLPLDRLIAFSQSVADMFGYAAAAEAAVSKNRDPRGYVSKRPAAARELMQHVRFGQTELGSFVANFYIRLPERQPELPDVPRREGDSPLERRTLERVMRGTAQARTASRMVDSSAIVANFATGLNANMCVALADAVVEFPGKGIDFVADLDPEWPSPEGTPRRVTVPSGAFHVVRSAAKKMRPQTPVATRTIEGHVTGLHHEGEHIRHGVEYLVIVVYREKGRTRRLRVVLNPEEYETALEAHRQNAPIRLTGEIERLRSRTYLLEPRDVSIGTD